MYFFEFEATNPAKNLAILDARKFINLISEKKVKVINFDK